MNILKGSAYLIELRILESLAKLYNILDRIDLITEKDKRQKSDWIPLVITYNRFLPNITKTIRKNRSILQINENFKEIFKNELRTAFKRNKNI